MLAFTVIPQWSFKETHFFAALWDLLKDSNVFQRQT